MTMQTRMMKGKIKSINISRILGLNFLVFSGIFMSGVFLYFLTAGKGLLLFQEEQYLFLFSADYLDKYLLKPGGMLEYTGRFLMQFYAVPAAGSFIIAAVLTLSGFLAFRIFRKLNPGSVLSLPVSMMVPVLLFLMQGDYYYFMEMSLGFICVLFSILLLIKYNSNYKLLILIPLLFYFTGSFAFIFVVSYIIYGGRRFNGSLRIYNPLIVIAITLTCYYIFRKILFLVPAASILTYPLSATSDSNRIWLVILSGILVLMPALNLPAIFSDRKESTAKYAAAIPTGLLFFSAVILLSGMQNPVVSGIIRLQKAAYDGRWDDIITQNEANPANNLVGQYFYNTALSEKGLLCEKLFTTGQDFGTKSLVMPWGNEHLERGAYFFYTTGLVNEAHRWAYEEMVVYGLRPHNLKMLIKTSLLSGDDLMAAKYTGILRRTLFYRDDAEYFESMFDNREKLLSDPELGAIARILPEKDFFIYTDTPEDNLPLLFESNSLNRRAFEYMMSWLLLEKDVETVLSNLHLMKGLGYTSLPRYIEEAVMIYVNSQKAFPEMRGLTVSRATLARFDQYFNAYRLARNNPVTLQETMKARFGDTFWYYYHFK